MGVKSIHYTSDSPSCFTYTLLPLGRHLSWCDIGRQIEVQFLPLWLFAPESILNIGSPIVKMPLGNRGRLVSPDILLKLIWMVPSKTQSCWWWHFNVARRKSASTLFGELMAAPIQLKNAREVARLYVYYRGALDWKIMATTIGDRGNEENVVRIKETVFFRGKFNLKHTNCRTITLSIIRKNKFLTNRFCLGYLCHF